MGRPRLTWLKTLNDSARNSSFVDSVIRKYLKIERSVCQKEGPRRLLRPALPNWLGPGTSQGVPAPTPPVNQWSRPPPPPGSPMRLGRQGPALVPGHDDSVGVNGSPLCHVDDELSCHPPRRRSTARAESLKYLRPFPTGMSQTSVKTKTCFRSKPDGP